jgi:HAMP domain-containing protein
MKGEKREVWMDLCARIASEQDPEEVLALAKQLNEMLKEKERQLGILPDREPEN